MRARFGKDLPVTSSLFSGSEGLTAKQQDAITRGPGHKRAPEETTIFRELNDWQNQLNSAGLSDEDEEAKVGAPDPTDATRRRQFATGALEEAALGGGASKSR